MTASEHFTDDPADLDYPAELDGPADLDDAELDDPDLDDPADLDDAAELLAPLAEVESVGLQALRRSLAERAERAGLVDIAYRTIDSPVGTLLLASTRIGLVRVAFDREDLDSVLVDLSIRLSPRILYAPARLEQVVVQLDEYFAGHRYHFDLHLDHTLSHGFRRIVLDYLPDISYGHTASYGAVAKAVGNPKAVRAVGTACATNPLPLVVPCHRVVRSNGLLGAYRGGPEAKRILHDLEAAVA